MSSRGSNPGLGRSTGRPRSQDQPQSAPPRRPGNAPPPSQSAWGRGSSSQQGQSSRSQPQQGGSRAPRSGQSSDVERLSQSMSQLGVQAGRSGEGHYGEGRYGEGPSGEGPSGEGPSGAGRWGEGRLGEGRSGEGRSGEGRSGEGRSGDGRPGEGRSGDGRFGDGRSGGRGAVRGTRQAGHVVLRTRPENVGTKKGTNGKKATFITNYFRFATKTDWCLYQYRVDFTPEEDRTMIRRMLLRDHKEKLGGYIFDGTVMFISHRLGTKDEVVTFTSKRRSDDAIINISCRLVGDVMYGNPQYLQFFNLMFRSFMGSLELQMVKRDFYDAKNKIVVDACNMELWPGYQTSIRQHENEILLCAEVTHKVMKRDTALDLLKKASNRERDFRTAFSKIIVGSVVLTDYNNRTYRVDDVDWSITPSSSFRMGERKVTYIEYMYEKYQIRIRDTKQPMLVSKSKPREVRAGQSDIVYLIPEVCRCTGLTDDDRSKYTIMQELAKFTRLNPNNRMRALINFIQRLSNEPKVRESMKLWQMRIAEQLTTVQGRILEDEKINFGDQRSCPPSADWMRSMKNNSFVYTVPLKKWAMVYLERMTREAEHLVSLLKQAGQSMRFHVPDPYTIPIRDDSAGSFVQALSHLLDRDRPQIVVCLVTNNRNDRYTAIKKVCYIDRGVPSQVVTAKVASKGGPIATKVILQMACKIGCIPWSIPNPCKGTMVVGFDVCHDSTRKELSYGAMVASTNDTFGSYFSCVSHHEHGQELSNNFSANILKAVREWERQNNSKPTRVIIYRDGVGDGDLEYVYQHEVALVNRRLAEIYRDSEVKLTFIIVNKRIKTRFFYESSNPPPGSVVDDVITQPERYDFYLVSQYVGQGSVSPTSYNIIHDTSGWKADNLQRLTYKLTHMYYNWPGPVRVPAPCQYAHKLAFLVGQALHRTTSQELETTLYYL